ncbi:MULTISPECIES: GTPase [Pseudoalteromonas]|uniref:50S ribosome-binding GTPase n=1 Tax=Pseudoalteromonas lipolytica TaxID=570156 RepID=A0ABY1GD71_9GAMM|nr:MULTISPECIES: GTPase [Pseudoalteromonas]MBE0352825.1 hypothetical protein [Pseudoalteromonas lipolytica LMEB 39]SFT41607.1 50S ribosome-binding GTPase [Pseudoalteromonas lipolytica]
MENYNEKSIDEKVDEMYLEWKVKLESPLNVLVLGKVSAGKSSFLNAFFDREMDDVLFEVNAKSGETTKVKFEKLGENISIADTPGLDDIKSENSAETLKMLDEGVDVGILVLSGSADKSQKGHYDDLLKNSSEVFIVLNKADNFSKENLPHVIEQWKEQLGLSSEQKIYPVVSRGYDPKDKETFRGQEYDIEVDNYGRPKTLQGIDAVRDDVLDFLAKKGKDLLLAKELKDKSKKALAIISTATASGAGAAFIPGSAAYLIGIQVVAIGSLGYLYTGEIISKSNAISLIGTFAAEQVGMNLFLLTKSFLPPTGVIDLAAAVIAASVTAAMLSAVAYLLSHEIDFDDKEQLLSVFNEIRATLQKETKSANKEDLLKGEFWISLIKKII